MQMNPPWRQSRHFAASSPGAILKTRTEVRGAAQWYRKNPERVVVAGVRPVPGLEVARAVGAAELPGRVVVADHATLRLRWAQFSC